MYGTFLGMSLIFTAMTMSKGTPPPHARLPQLPFLPPQYRWGDSSVPAFSLSPASSLNAAQGDSGWG